MKPLPVLVPVLLALAACAAPPAAEAPVRLHPGLSAVQREVCDASPAAQACFDQGLALTWAFHHDEAIRSFERAAELSPGCAMAWWGIAFAHGPHINNPFMDEAASRRAHEAVQRALELVGGDGPIAPPGERRRDGRRAVERNLVRALARRYAWPPPADRAELDRAFADAMREVWRAHPRDADVGALCAEALMNLRPWDLWSPEGEMRPETPEVLAVLAEVEALAPQHPQANHLLIHAWEASPQPERAAPAADRLRGAVPGAGHLVHMPGHIDVRLGRWQAAIDGNLQAIAADQALLADGARHGFWDMYRAHNIHFVVYAALFEGREALALQHARSITTEIPPEVIDRYLAVLESFVALPYHVLVRFGRWEAILAEPAPPPGRPVSLATHHYARGMALATLGRLDEAQRELDALHAACAAVPAEQFHGNNPARDVLAVGVALLEGELLYRRAQARGAPADFEAAFARLREAVSLSDALRYDEPWGWMQPPRHALGALLLEQGRVAEAEACYREDLTRHPDNGWSLTGLAECLQRRGAAGEAREVAARANSAFARADARPDVSCLCRRG